MSTIQVNNNFNAKLEQAKRIVNENLALLLKDQKDIFDQLEKAMRYCLEGPGKRVRGALVLFCCELTGGSVNENAKIAAAAVEMAHTYSLVHDDLPAMDDDQMRRGRPTCHIAFDEATAILTGDALLTLAFDVLATRIDSSDCAVSLIRELSAAIGPAAMISGQMADLHAEKIRGTEKLLQYIHTNKTAKLFACAVVCGAICGRANPEQINRLREYGLEIGLGFQIADDILDVSSSSEQIGKTVGKDAKAQKCTYPAVVGLDKSRLMAEKTAEKAVALLDYFGKKSDTLRQLTMMLLARTR